MRQSEARDMRSFLAEPVEEVMLEDARAQIDTGEQYGVGAQYGVVQHGVGAQHSVGVRFDVGAQFISPPDTGVQHGVGARFDVGAQFISPPDTGVQMDTGEQYGAEAQFILSSSDYMLQPKMPMQALTNAYDGGPQSGQSPLRPYHLRRYQSRGVDLSPLTSGALQRRSSGRQGSGQTQARATADLVPMPHKLVPIEPSPALGSWEGRRRDIYMWLVLFTLFLLVTLGGIGLDSLIASYH